MSVKDNSKKFLKNHYIDHYTKNSFHVFDSEGEEKTPYRYKYTIGFRDCEHMLDSTWHSKLFECPKKYLGKRLNVEITNVFYPNAYEWIIDSIEVVEDFDVITERGKQLNKANNV